MRIDRLTPELRRIEKEVDHYYKSNPLVNLPFATAAWYLLAFAEDYMQQEKIAAAINGIQDLHALASDFIVEIEHPMAWLYNACEQDGQVSFVYDKNLYKASRDLFELGKKYDGFVFAYTCASNGVLGLELQGSTIQPTANLLADIRYEAYNRLIKPYKSAEVVSMVDFDNVPTDTIRHSVKIKSDRFCYKLNPKMVSDTITAFTRPILNATFSLPSKWQFSHYSLEDFRKVVEAILAMAYIHATARRTAVIRGCMGYADSIYLRPFDDLLRQVVRYSGVLESEVRSIFDDLSYGNREILQPDPALQPLIKLNSEIYAIVPHLWFSCSAERNLTVLLNKLPSEKGIYAKFVDEKEELMRGRFTASLSDTDFRFIQGNIRGLPDIDLAIISDAEKVCLLLELKWFIDPAEAREIIERSQEIEKGISQVLKLKQAFANNHTPLLEKLKIDSSHRLEGVVVSENWIGHAKVQSPEIPVIQANHLIAKLKAAESLQSVMEWLQDRKYLPREGEHFKVHMTTHTIGDWSLKWYEIQPLISDAFFPL